MYHRQTRLRYKLTAHVDWLPGTGAVRWDDARAEAGFVGVLLVFFYVVSSVDIP